ncbi:MAG: sarcosine oxidase subunit beta family protein [Rhodospirillaceae bacterium]|nr:sarcosine oxidase subunit beta family protein [Rhodospirillaceae bacterium]
MPRPRYSIFSLARNALAYHQNWTEAWRSPAPKPHYKVIIVGAGGHGLSTAYYLAKEHGITDVAVLDKGWLGGGNVARNTTIVRSDYLFGESIALYDKSLSMWHDLSRELNFNTMFSPRGIVKLIHNRDGQREAERRFNALRLAGVDSEMLTPLQVKRLAPMVDISPGAAHPVLGATLQRRGGIARHDAVAWGYARAADALGVDMIQHCEVTGFRIEGGRVKGVETVQGFIGADAVALVPAGHVGVLAAKAGFRLPIESVTMQAMVSEPVKPCLDTVVMSPIPFSLSQSDNGEFVFGMSTEPYNSYSQRGTLPHIEEISANAVSVLPGLSRLRMLRKWGGVLDVSRDVSPIMGRTPVEGMYVNCGWGTGGFKSIPGSGWAFSHMIAQDRPHDLMLPFGLDRFAAGALIDEHAASGSFEAFK